VCVGVCVCVCVDDARRALYIYMDNPRP